MEPYPGLFVSSIEAAELEPDEDVPGSEMHELVHADGTWAGLTRFVSVDEPVPYVPPHRETILVLEGAARIAIADGPTLDLKVGDLASLPAGVETVWHITAPFKELWFFAPA